MAELFSTGYIVDAIVGLLLVEGILLFAFHRRTGRGVPFADMLGTLLSGAFLLLALRAALVKAPWSWIALCLLAALLAHLADLRRRWRS